MRLFLVKLIFVSIPCLGCLYGQTLPVDQGVSLVESGHIKPTEAELKRQLNQLELVNEILRRTVERHVLQHRLGDAKMLATRVNDNMPEYLDHPYDEQAKSLTLSDRKIILQGEINAKKSAYLCDMIDFYNNKSAQPIFLVIVHSLGGGVLSGLRVINKIANSQAPVYVVVTELAASMAAVLAARARLSFALPDAWIVHHEPRVYARDGGGMFTPSMLDEQSEHFRLVEEKVMGPLMEKFGYANQNEWKEDLFKHSRSGEWGEFASTAVGLGWVSKIAEKIVDTGIRSMPEGAGEQKKEEGNS